MQKHMTILQRIHTPSLIDPRRPFDSLFFSGRAMYLHDRPSTQAGVSLSSTHSMTLKTFKPSCCLILPTMATIVTFVALATYERLWWPTGKSLWLATHLSLLLPPPATHQVAILLSSPCIKQESATTPASTARMAFRPRLTTRPARCCHFRCLQMPRTTQMSASF